MVNCAGICEKKATGVHGSCHDRGIDGNTADLLYGKLDRKLLPDRGKDATGIQREIASNRVTAWKRS